MSLTEVTITATFKRPNGEPVAGQVTAQLEQQITNGTTEVNPTPIQGYLNAKGELKAMSTEPFKLYATDDAGTEPTGVRYHFTVQLDGAPLKDFYAALPKAVSPVDLTALEGLT